MRGSSKPKSKSSYGLLSFESPVEPSVNKVRAREIKRHAEITDILYVIVVTVGLLSLQYFQSNLTTLVFIGASTL